MDEKTLTHDKENKVDIEEIDEFEEFQEIEEVQEIEEELDLDEIIIKPESIEDLGVSKELINDLILKHLYYEGEMTGLDLAQKMRVPYNNVIELFIDKLLKQKFLFYEGGRGFGRSSMKFALTDSGKDSAKRALELNNYVGPLPVSLDKYKKMFTSLNQIVSMKLGRLKELLSDLILPNNFYYSIGPAINSNHSIFLYGPPGNGKSVVADKIARALEGSITIPYAIEIDGQIVKLYDKIFHTIIETHPLDKRWVKIKRPYVFVGGELTYNMLNLNFDPVSKVYEAPLQLKANGGVFLIDDFGRQKEAPSLFLNRWIVPLENRFDILNLSSGKSFIVPFEQLIIFSTNIDPKELVDEAFSRRIRYKIGLENPTPEMFLKIFVKLCKAKKVKYKLTEIENYFFYNVNPTPKIRAVLPRDLLEIIEKIAAFEEIENEVNFYTLKKASEIGFIQNYTYELSI
jgi:predicted ATPase with chaperone activity